MRYLALALSFFTLSAPSAFAAAGPACFFDVYQPDALVAELKVGLPASGIAVVNLNRGEDKSNSRMLLMRDGAIVGELYASVDPRAAKSEMTVLSATGDVLMHFAQSTKPCSDGRVAGLCTKVEGYTELEATLDGHPAYSLYAKQGGGMPSYYRYDANVGRLEFRRALVSSFDWLVATLDATDVTREPVSATTEEKFYWKLAAVPGIAPYLDRLTIANRRGQVVVMGVVPSNFVYDQIVSAALDAGLYEVVPDLVIDTRTEVSEPRWILSRCF